MTDEDLLPASGEDPRVVEAMATVGDDFETLSSTAKGQAKLGVGLVVDLYACGSKRPAILKAVANFAPVRASEAIVARIADWHEYYLAAIRGGWLETGSMTGIDAAKLIRTRFKGHSKEALLAAGFMMRWIDGTQAKAALQEATGDYISRGASKVSEAAVEQKLKSRLEEPTRSVALAFWKSPDQKAFRERALRSAKDSR